MFLAKQIPNWIEDLFKTNWSLRKLYLFLRALFFAFFLGAAFLLEPFFFLFAGFLFAAFFLFLGIILKLAFNEACFKQTSN